MKNFGSLDLSERGSEKLWMDLKSFSYGVYQLVGHGEQTKVDCGHGFSWYGCLNTDLHNRVGKGIDGFDYTNKGFFKRLVDCCDKPSCPKCYLGWASKEAKLIEKRLLSAVKHFRSQNPCLLSPKVEHLVVSPPKELYELSEPELRKKCEEALFKRGVVGGAMIQHAFRYDRVAKRGFFSIHYHFLGFFAKPYKCRGCKRVCQPNCDGFENVTRLVYEEDGFIVKVASAWEERMSVGGTAWYQLNHSSFDMTKKRARVVTWMGVCSYRKLKLSASLRREIAEKYKEVCPLCKDELKPLLCFSDVAKAFGSGFPKKGLWLDVYDEYGLPLWAVDDREKWRKG